MDHILKMLLISVSAFVMLSCAQNNSDKSKVSGIDSAENHFFKMDFTENNYEISDVENLFFTTFPHDDPTQGDVIYDQKKWINKDIIQLINGDGLYLYIKSRSDSMFDSFRLTTKAFYNLNEDNQRILFVFKGKFPSSKGIWPAWWLNGSKENPWIYKNSGKVATDADLDKFSGKGHFYDTSSPVNGTDWPGSGEIDIIETINGDSLIHNTIHTCPQMCDSEWNSDGQIINCANAVPGDPNSGCSGKPYVVKSPEGTFALLWEKNSLKFYYWEAGNEVRKQGGPLSDKPQPDLWQGSILKNEVRLIETDAECDDDSHQDWQCNNCEESTSCVFTNMKMIFNATLCGKWAGNKFDESVDALQNCRKYIFSDGKEKINNQFMKIEYVSVSKI